jgi:hypothetical protein
MSAHASPARRLGRALLAAASLCALYACARKEWNEDNAFVVLDVVSDVKTLRAKELDWKPTAVRDLMRPDDKLQTFAGASATIGLKNDQQLFVRELTLIVFGDYDKDDARARTSGVLEIKSGKVQTRSLAAARRDDMSYRTPNSEIAVARRGEEGAGYDLLIDAGGDDKLSVLSGTAAVKAQGASVSVPEEFGTRVKAGQAPEPPRPLPPAPRLAGGPSGFFRADLFEGLPFSWSASTGAASYRLVVARDPGFVSVVHDETLGGTSGLVRSLPAGAALSWRVSALDADGLEGRPSAPGTLALAKAFPDAVAPAAQTNAFSARRRDVGERHYLGGYVRRPDLGDFDIVAYALVDAWYLQWYPYSGVKPRPVLDADGYWEMRVNGGSRYRVYLVRKGAAALPDARRWGDPPAVDGKVILAEVDAAR